MRYLGLAGLLLAGVAHAQVVSHLNLVSNKSQDVSSLEAWKKTYIKEGMSDQEKAVAIFNTMTRYRHQANPPREGMNGSPQAEGHVHDPLKTIHVYGYGQCCCASADVEVLSRYLGIPARGRDITAHSVPELYYNNAWHLVDCSVMNYHLNDKGELASVDEIHNAVTGWLKNHPELVNNDKGLRAFAKDEGWKKGPELLSKSDAFYGKNGVNSAGWHGWPSTMQEYYKVQGEQEFSPTVGYELNVQLRPGETITRNFFSRGIEYTNEMSKTYYAQLQDRKLLGLQTKLGDAAPGRVGDGTMAWDVPMAQLKDVALSSDDNSFVLRFPCSYVYVKGSAAVKTTGPVTVSISDTNGVSWKEVTKLAAGENTVDLTPLIKRRYDFRLKFDLDGGAKVESIKTALDFQCSQAALPVIDEGENRMNFSAGAQEGTITIQGSTDPDGAKKLGQVSVADFKPELKGITDRLAVGDSGTGDAIFDVATPGEMTRIRLSAVWRARDKADGFQLSYSTDGGTTYTPVKDGQLEGGTKGLSRYLVIDNLPAGTKAAKVKISGTQRNTAVLWDFAINADYKEPAGAFKPVKITYTWEESGQAKTFEHIAKTPQDAFDITCGPKTVAKSFAMQLAE
jgi:hypothetical protein